MSAARDGDRASAEQRAAQLLPPTGACRVVIDTDAANEIDDQFALVWALQSPDRLQIEAVLAEPYSFEHLRDGLLDADADLDSTTRTTVRGPASPEHRGWEIVPEAGARSDLTRESAKVDSFRAWATGLREAGIDPRDVEFVGPAEGMERSYDEVVRVFECTGTTPGDMVFRGAAEYLKSQDQPIESAAVDRLIELAMAPGDGPLYVAAIGCVTNIASALLMRPEIAERIVVLWTAGYPTWCPRPNTEALNLVQDVVAARALFDSRVPLVYFPGYYVGAQLRISLPDVEAWVRGRGAAGNYLHDLYTNNPLHEQRAIADHYGRTWVMWDMITIAWLIEPSWVPSEIVSRPTIDDELRWTGGPGIDREMREAHDIDRDAIFRDFFTKLDAHAN